MDKRILKPQWQRKPEDKVRYDELVSLVSKESGFRKQHVKIVVDSMINQVIAALENKKQINLPGVGTLYPTIKRSRNGMSLNGGKGEPTKIIVPDRWMARFQASKDLERKLFSLSISEEELNALYK